MQGNQQSEVLFSGKAQKNNVKKDRVIAGYNLKTHHAHYAKSVLM